MPSLKFLLLSVLIFVGSLHGVDAQALIKIADDQKKPLVGVLLAINTSDTSPEYLLTNDKGIAKYEGSLPATLIARHIGFSEGVMEITQNESYELILKPSVTQLEDVVVTGQYEPQTARNSVFKVKTISLERLQQQGANSLQDILSTELNIRFQRDNATGTSGITMQGISGQNVKVLIDGIPVVGRSGVDNEIDLSQINVNTIEKIEVVEGPMAVNFGADALAGVINIITKKGNSSSLESTIASHHETVGQEFSLFQQGIHNTSFQISGKSKVGLVFQGDGRVQHFGGWKGGKTGREHLWYPKTQYFLGTGVRYHGKNSNLSYRLDYLDEKIQNLGTENNIDPLRDPFAVDENYLTTRWMHQVQGEWAHRRTRWNGVASYTDFQRLTHQFVSNLTTGETNTTSNSEQDTVVYRSLFARITGADVLSFQKERIKMSSQLGLETTHETAGGSTLAPGLKQMVDVAGFASFTFTLGALQVRPGIRWGINSIYPIQPSPAINTRWEINENIQFRMAYGRGYRVPSIRELYHEFIDANHNILGNPELSPELSHSITGDISYRLQAKVPLSLSIGGFYNTISDRITFFIPVQANQPTTYENLESFTSTGTQINTEYQINKNRFTTGFSYIGISQTLSDTLPSIPGFVFSPEFNTTAQLYLKPIDSYLNLFYKYTGSNKSYQLVESSEGEFEPTLVGLSPFHFLDITASKEIKGLNLSLGIRNALDTETVNFTSGNSGIHSGNQSQIAYGRSYFLRIQYTFSKK